MADSRYVLVVCTANICRSPMAAALLEHACRAQPEPLRSLKVLSAGVSARGGQPATEHSVTALRKVGIDLTGHVSRPVTQELLDGALTVLCMTEGHRAILEAGGNKEHPDIHLFREWVGPGRDPEIPDPYGGPLALYEACRDEMVEAIPGLVTHLKALSPGA